jgi:hypothetical protein
MLDRMHLPHMLDPLLSEYLVSTQPNTHGVDPYPESLLEHAWSTSLSLTQTCAIEKPVTVE